jgi:hypothetical protein
MKGSGRCQQSVRLEEQSHKSGLPEMNVGRQRFLDAVRPVKLATSLALRDAPHDSACCSAQSARLVRGRLARRSGETLTTRSALPGGTSGGKISSTRRSMLISVVTLNVII